MNTIYKTLIWNMNNNRAHVKLHPYHADPPLQVVFSSLKSPQSLSPSQGPVVGDAASTGALELGVGARVDAAHLVTCRRRSRHLQTEHHTTVWLLLEMEAEKES